MRVRIEVTDQHGSVVRIIDADAVLGKLTPAKRARTGRIASALVLGIQSILGCDEDHARQVAAAELLRAVADEEAYERRMPPVAAQVTREQFERVVREQITRCVTNALTAGVPSNGIMNRATETILQAAATCQELTPPEGTR